MKDFYVDKKKRKKIIKNKRREISGIAKGLLVFRKLLVFFACLPLMCVGMEIIRRKETDFMIIFCLIFFASFISGIIGLISIIIIKCIDIRYLRAEISDLYMELHLQKNGVEYGSTTQGLGDYHRSFYFEYKDIEKLEYDRKNHIFRISGKYVNKTWKNVNRGEIIKAHEKTEEIKTVTFFECFQNFEDFLAQIQDQTGLCVKNVEIKI